MKREILKEALGQISDEYIAAAAVPKRRKSRLPWLGAIAAVLAVVILVTAVGTPTVRAAKAVSIASESRKSERPDYNSPAWDLWHTEQEARNTAVELTRQNLAQFFSSSCEVFLTNSGENRVWSPVNGYIALAMLAEVTGSSSRTQILELLNTPDLDTLRSQVSAVWEAVYQDDGKEISVLANSVWLDTDLTYTQEIMDTLAYDYYASVYQGDLGSTTINQDLQSWLNKNTGGLLKKAAAGIELDPETVLALASTVYLKSQWSDDFSSGNNTTGVFHGADGDTGCTYMNKPEHETSYYWGENYGAVQLSMKNSCQMWFFLPDEGKTVSDILSEGQYLDCIWPGSSENHKYMKVNLSVPKFDVSSEADLKEGLQLLGITDVFSKETADFTPSMGDFAPVWVDSVKQAARVSIDEEGVEAASYIVIPNAGAGQPPDEVIDFVLNRPFLFVIASNRLPLFAGVVNNP